MADALTPLESCGFAHGKPPPDHECMCTMEDITEEDGNYCEYQTAPSMKWHTAKYSADTVKRLINTQFSEYVAGVRKAYCQADLKRRIAKGPPMWVEDKHAMPIPEDDTHICRVWMASDGVEYSAKLAGCKEVRRCPRCGSALRAPATASRILTIDVACRARSGKLSGTSSRIFWGRQGRRVTRTMPSMVRRMIWLSPMSTASEERAYSCPF